MLESITGAITMGYFKPVGDGWVVAGFFGLLALILFILLNIRVAQVAFYKAHIQRLTKLLGNTLQ